MEGVTRRFPLDEIGWGIQDVFNFLASEQVEIPERTDCALCFYQTLYEWYLLWRDEPVEWALGEHFELWTGHTFRSDQRDTQPAAMIGLRRKFENGYIPKDRRKKRSAMCSVCAR